MKTNRFGNYSHLPRQSSFDIFLLGVIVAGGVVGALALGAAAFSHFVEAVR